VPRDGRDSLSMGWGGAGYGTPLGPGTRGEGPVLSGRMERSGPVMVLTDGDLAGLVTCAVEVEWAASRRRTDACAWFLPVHGSPAESTIRAATLQAGALGLALAGPEPLLPPSEEGEGLHTLCGLMRAAMAAGRRGCRRLVWPVRGVSLAGEPELDAIAVAVDRAALLSRLIGLKPSELGVPALTVDTPLVDMSDAHLAELAIDLNVPLETCWWWGGRPGAGPGRRDAASVQWSRWAGHLGLEARAEAPRRER
jgi:hypothetical protein